MDKIVEKKSFIRELTEWIVCIAIAFVIALFVRYFIFTPTLVKQGSMTPTIIDGERVLINRMSRTFKSPIFRGEIVTFESPIGTDEEKMIAVYDNKNRDLWNSLVYNVLEIGKTSYIKRVIGIEGDHVLIKNGKVYVNDKLQSEVYLNGIDTPRTGIYYDLIVPEGYLFVMGDNRDGSTDSRVFGCIPTNKIEGKVTYRIWPLSKFGKIDK